MAALAELLGLTQLQVLHGALDRDADVSHLSSLRGLRQLALLPDSEGGLCDAHVEQLAGLRTPSLTSLAIRPHAEAATPGALWRLTALTCLRRLSVAPLPDGCGAADLQPLFEMPALSALQLGTRDAAQVLCFTELRLRCGGAPAASLVLDDACEPGPAADVLSVLSWTLPQLTSLCVGALAAPSPNDVLVTLAALTRLRRLRLTLVAPPGAHSSGAVDLLALAALTALTELELTTSERVYLPLSVKTLSLAALTWPRLAALRLSPSGGLPGYVDWGVWCVRALWPALACLARR